MRNSPKLNIGEAPHYDPCTSSLYFVDLFGEKFTLFRYDLGEDKFYSAKIEGEGTASIIIPIKGRKNRYAVGLEDGVKEIKWNGKSNTARVTRTIFLTARSPGYLTNHMNDCKADPKGRFYGGTLTPPLCNFAEPANSTFYRYTKRKGLKRILTHVRVSNGLAFNKKEKKFYYVDSCAFNIREFKWNSKSGALCMYILCNKSFL